MDTSDSAAAPGDDPGGEPSFAASPVFGAPLIGGPIEAVPAHLARDLVPAQWVVREWERYTFVHAGAREVWIGAQRIAPYPGSDSHFEVRFENQLGLATIRVVDSEGRTHRHHVEVVAPKLGAAEESVAFLRATLMALHARIASTPFVLGAATERFVRESPTPPGLLFLFHFFRQHGPELVRAIQAVLGRPHQQLVDESELVRPHEVRQVDREAIIRMLQAGRPSATTPVGSTATMKPLQRLRPERVWQRIPEETWDTPENRFVLAICRRMLTAHNGLVAASWFARDVPAPARQRVEAAGTALAMLTVDDRFAPLGPMVVTPVQSRVLQRRDGYRELALLWQRFQRSREPLFEHLQSAIDLRSVDQLYELWLLFELIDQIGEMTGEVPVLTGERLSAFGVPMWRYAAVFGDYGTLVYNDTVKSYSDNSLRPDYWWKPADGRPGVALDAKFRLTRPAMFTGEVADDLDKVPQGKAYAKSDDLTKMHAYRDAIPKVRAAVVLYPGTESVFRDAAQGRQSLTLAEVLGGEWEGVGAIAMSPQMTQGNDGEIPE
jgi:uncharacterized protein